MATFPRTATRLFFALSPLLLAAACGGNEPQPVTPAAPPASAAPPAPPAPDVSAVPDPAGLVLSGRLAKASAVLQAAQTWTSLPTPGSEQVSEMLTGEAIGPVVDLDQPIDLALAVEGTGARMKVVLAVSAAVKDPDKVKATFAGRYKLTPGDDGATIIGGLGARGHDDADKNDEDDDDDKSSGKGGDDDGSAPRLCELAPAYGAASVRLVCGLSGSAFVPAGKSLKLLGPWLARTATRSTATTDLHMDLRMAPLEPTIKSGRALINTLLGAVLRQAPGGRVLGDLVTAGASDLIDFATDLDSISIDGTLGAASAQLDFAMHVTGSSSTFGKIIEGHAERNGPPPAAFWQLPADADTASYSRGIDASILGPVRQTVLDAMGAGLVDVGLKPADAKALQAAIAKMPIGVGGVYAAGVDGAAVRQAAAASKALGKDDKSPKKRDARRAVAEAMLGWRVVEIDQPSSAIAPALKDLAAAVARPSVAAAVHAQDKDFRFPRVATAPVPATAGLPAGAMQWVIEITPAPRKAKDGDDAKPKAAPLPGLPVRVHVYLVPDGARTWLAVGEEKAAAAKLAASMAGGGSNLGSRADLASLKDSKLGSAGFVTGLAMAVSDAQRQALMKGSAHGAGALFDEVDRMPNKGMSPLVFSMTPQPGGPPATVVLGLGIPRGAIEDAAAEFVRHVKVGGDEDDSD